MPFVKLIMNFSLLSALLLGPAALLLALWYRRSFVHTFMIWRRPEAAMIFVAYLVLALILIISGTASIFNFYRLIQNPETTAAATNFKDIALICFSAFTALTFIFSACRLVLVQIITEKGLIINHSVFRIPIPNQIVKWNQLSDYYIQRDYPNAVFNIIYRKEGTAARKVEIPVPAYLQEKISRLLDSQLDGENDLILFHMLRQRRRS